MSSLKQENALYKELIHGVLEDYKNTYNAQFPKEQLEYNVTLVDQELDINKVRRDSGVENIPEEEELVKVKYLRVEEVTKRENDAPHKRLILSQAYPTEEPITKNEIKQETLDNIIYKDILFLLISAGIEQHAMAAIHKEQEEKRNKLANINDKQANGSEKIETFKSMPKPLSKDDKEYVEWIKKEKDKLKGK